MRNAKFSLLDRRSWSGLRRSALVTSLIGASVLVVSGLFVPSVTAAALCATPPLTGATSVTGVINTYYPGQTSIAAGTANTTVTVGTGRGSAAPIGVGDLVMVMQMQGAQIDVTNSNTYGDGVSSATASGYLTNSSFIAGQYEYATVRSVAGAVIGLDGAGTNGGLVNGYANAAESATQGQQRFQVVRVPQYSSASLSAATPPAAVAWDGSSGGIVVLDVAISDPNGVLGVCIPVKLTPGQSLTCTAIHTVTAADLAATVILNTAHATALPVTDFEEICPLLDANGLECHVTALISAESNTVVLNRSAFLPRTGGTVLPKLILGSWLLGVGGLLLVTGRRRRRPQRR
jgi:hypothetical protein